jgi:hypothetical protein
MIQTVLVDDAGGERKGNFPCYPKRPLPKQPHQTKDYYLPSYTASEKSLRPKS